ncbi:MAG: SDR family NAD(P)-dependent oxidoreductase [Limimaricola sp.]|uniref:SDR family NAD(P)-dependent oxidoreductase n=1 Tax=Limimaricola sp. TaxID=2211665 RepID=UPI001D8EFCFE|nr:SDR family NAD(P)-dependent oxidoreductase [Limimaricola sp.]MBI1417632.1 SDR family NAD(P)-dependent oxidoreductase [Limimaricola sp.]
MAGAALIVGTGPGLSASLARLLSAEGYDVTLVARDTAKLGALRDETGATLQAADATDASAIGRIVDALPGPLRIAVYNASARVRGPLPDLDPADVRRAVDVTAFGAFVTGQAAARRMLAQDPEAGCRGTILFTGASAGVKGFPQSASFAMGKFAQRGLAQSMARELHPQGVHAAWVNIDGAIRNPGRTEASPDSMLDPDAIARAYLGLVRQDRSAWSSELELRPWVEKF